ncbi:MAG: winged helix-turn-helix transcriptional regulator [Thermoflexales bacterium]|nr:winged helix-turn-helix transcriptional regulator [Thermoflexales bacterium]
MADSRSCVIFGEPGSGKTAIYRELEALNIRPDGRPVRLIVHWRPAPLPPEEHSGLPWVSRLTREMLDACASALVHHLYRFPEDYTGVSEWVQERIIWFIHRYTLGPPEVRWKPLAEGSEPGAPLIRQVLGAPVPTVLYNDAPSEMVLAELLSAVKGLGMEGIWVMTDGLEGWASVAPEHLTESLKAFLSTLSLFSPSGPVYKLFLPAEMEPAVSRASGMARRRIEGIRIRWDPSMLQGLVERRLAFAFGKETFSLDQLCSAPTLRKWLEKVGGTSPREWLDQVAVLAEYYMANPQDTPIGEETWKRLRQEHPPRFYLDEERRQVRIGGRLVNLEDLPAKAYDMLCYLYRHSGQVVTKAELYFRVYLGKERIPRPGDDGYEAPTQYAGLIDTNLWRLRQAIEPDPREPVLLLTRRGHGVVLQVRW